MCEVEIVLNCTRANLALNEWYTETSNKGNIWASLNHDTQKMNIYYLFSKNSHFNFLLSKLTLN